MPEQPSESNSEPPRGRLALLHKHHWITFLLPMIVYMLAGSLEPTPDTPGGYAIGLSIPYAHYPWVYAAKIVLTIAAMIFVLPGYREFPLKVSWLGIAVGVVGIVAWVGLCKLDLEHRFLVPLLEPVGLDGLIAAGTRSAFDPFKELAAHPAGAWGFLAVRFLGLAAVVAVIEEFFLRGFVMRFVVAANWWEVPFGRVTATAVVVGTVLPMAMHPGELLAAAVWFSMVTWLMIRTRNIWDCVAAHAVTNFLLGVYVVASGDWHLM